MMRRLTYSDQPHFSSAVPNISVAKARDAHLPCSVRNIGHRHKVRWLKAPSQTVLTVGERVVTKNPRVSVSTDNRTWTLHIRHVELDDNGCYICQVTTLRPTMQTGCIEVNVPPNVIQNVTSSDTEASENGEVRLRCKANGRPQPKILWKREDGKFIFIRTGDRQIRAAAVEGEYLFLKQIERRQAGVYLCIASNGIPPAVVKRIMLEINFAPEAIVSTKIVSVPLGSPFQLRCTIEAYPRSITYWEKQGGEIIIGGGAASRYEVEDDYTDGYKIIMKLTVTNSSKSDFTSYFCIAKNSLGEARGEIEVLELSRHEIEQQQTLTYATLGQNYARSMRPTIVFTQHFLSISTSLVICYLWDCFM